jgi:hypothetical protein
MLMHNHPVHLGAPRDMGGGGKPLILQRSDDDFIEATLDDLRSLGGRQTLAALRARSTNRLGVLKLFQPVQRQFHLAVLEAWCEMPGLPRIAPAKVAAAGLLLRRLGADGKAEGWMRSKGRVRGWLPLARVGGEASDPAAARRLTQSLTGVADIDRQFTRLALQQPDKLLNEDVIPLYVAPPDVCAEAGKTLYYGLVPTVSSELSEAEPVFATDDSFGPDSRAFRDHLVDALRGNAMDFPFAGETVQGWWFGALESVGTEPPRDVNPLNNQFKDLKNAASVNNGRMRRFLMLLRQLAGEFNAFDGGDEVSELRRVLHEVQLPLLLRPGETVQRQVRADDFLARASKLLLSNEAIPGHWRCRSAGPRSAPT